MKRRRDGNTWPSGHLKIFSGPGSEKFWDRLNALSTLLPEPVGTEVWNVLYDMAAKLQELEAQVERLRQAELDRKVTEIQRGGE
jgi:hypothetical protein